MAKQSPFLFLSTAAMALPAVSEQPVETTISVKASRYSEEDVSDRSVILGDSDRYEIDIGQFRLIAPVGQHWSIDLDVSRETMSGASPWGTVLGADNEPALIMSGATIRESRTEVNFSVTRHEENAAYRIGLGQSEEDDYEAKAVSVSGEWEFNDRHSTLSAGFSYSTDDLAPTEAQLFGRVTSADKRTRSLNVGWTQVLSKDAVAQVGVGVTRHDGFLSDPYKLRDVRPDERTEWSLSLRYRRYFDNRNAALHLDYRYFDDDWGIESHTTYVAWFQSLGATFKLVPNVRYYSQDEADFYLGVDNFFLSTDIPQSSDFRLSGYGAWTLGLKAIYQPSNWAVTVSYDNYRADGSYGHSASRQDHPALLEFSLTSVGFSISF